MLKTECFAAGDFLVELVFSAHVEKQVRGKIYLLDSCGGHSVCEHKQNQVLNLMKSQEGKDWRHLYFLLTS